MLGDDIATKRFIDAEATSATQHFEGLSEKSRGMLWNAIGDSQFSRL